MSAPRGRPGGRAGPPRVRPLHPGECARALELARDALPALRLEPRDLRRNLFEPGRRPGAVVLTAEAGGRLAGVAAGALRSGEGAGGLRGHVKLLAVDPGARRRGLGGRLLAAVEAALERAGAGVLLTDGAAPVYLQPGVPHEARAAAALLEARGWEEVEERRSLSVDLRESQPHAAAAAERLRAAGIAVDFAGREDTAELADTVARRFSAAWAEEAVEAVRAPGAATRIARSGGELVGFATSGLWARNAFGPMGTDPRWTGRGVGSGLLLDALAELRERGERQAVIAWVGPEGFYRRVSGVRAVLRYRVFRKELRPTGAPGAAGPAA